MLSGGDLLTNVTGVLDYHFGGWSVQPTEAADYTAGNPRPEVPEVGGEVTVASFNVLNYFTTLGYRGAESAEEFDRQEAKIVSAIAEIDADVVGLIEIENNGTAVPTLVDALNDDDGCRHLCLHPDRGDRNRCDHERADLPARTVHPQGCDAGADFRSIRVS